MNATNADSTYINSTETGNFAFFGYVVGSITDELAAVTLQHPTVQDYPRRIFYWETSLLLHQQSCPFRSYSVALRCLHLPYPQSFPSYKKSHTSKENIQILTASVVNTF